MKEEITYNGKEYKLIKEYKHYGLYEDMKTGFKRCFDRFDLGLIKRCRKENDIVPERKFIT